MPLYGEFKKLDIDFEEIGMIQREECEGYFCTPKGARIIGWAGVDGIHYCFIRGFGETVFAVSPMNGPGEYIHPLAQDFGDFLRLLVACRDLAAMEQAWQWKKDVFVRYVEEIEVTAEKQAIFDLLADRFGIQPMKDPYEYMAELQAAFDYGSIRFTSEYYETTGEPLPGEEEEEAPEWKVYFTSGFFERGHCGRDRPGEEMPLNVQFAWDHETWHIPAAYACGAGLVVDFCIEIQPEEIRAFMEKWKVFSDKDGEALSPEERHRAELENPLNTRFRPVLTVNDRIMREKRGCALSFIPDELLEPGTENSGEAETVLAHYGLDRSKGWSVHRVSFPWATKKKPAVRSVKLHLEAEETALSGEPFPSPEVGEPVLIPHPTTGIPYTLTAEAYEKQEMNREHLPEDMEYPPYFTVMTYTLTPELPGKCFSVRDCEANDPPRKKPVTQKTGTADASVMIVGGADGPTAVMFVPMIRTGEGKRTACSAFRFTPADTVTWRPVFRIKLREDREAVLLG